MIRLAIVIILFVFPGFFNNSYAKGVIKVCFSTLPPWKIVNNEKFEGPGADIAKAIGEKLNRKIEFTSMPFRRGLHYLKHGEYDLMTGLLKNKKREKYIRYVDPPYKTKSNKVFYILKESPIKIKKYEDLVPLTVGTQNAVSYFNKFDRDIRINKHSVKKINQNILMLMSKRVDTFIGTESSVDYIINKMGFSKRIRKADFGYYDYNPVYIGLSKKSDLNNPRVVFLIREMIIDGEIDIIIRKFFSSRGLPIPDYK